MVAHQSISAALATAIGIQHTFHSYDWGTRVMDDMYCEITKERRRNKGIWNGLRIRVGIAYGTCDGQLDPITGGWDYYGTVVNTVS